MADEDQFQSPKQTPTHEARHIFPRRLSARAIREKFRGLEQCLRSRSVRNDETQDEFDLLFDHLLEATSPRDAIEFIYVLKAADHTVQINRYERDREGILVAEQIRLLRQHLKDQNIKTDLKILLLEWSVGNASAVEAIDKILQGHGITPQQINSKALENKIDSLQKIEAIINSVEKRRFDIFKEIDRIREAFGRQLKEAIRNQDGSYSILGDEANQPLMPVAELNQPAAQ